MAIANDNYYGYVRDFLVRESVTWLECAASSMFWSTILVYYLEAPYGHLMLEPMSGPEARAKIRGNLFSFAMPWEDIESACASVLPCPAMEADRNLRSEIRRNTFAMNTVPHDEKVLASLLNVHIVGGSTDLAVHLEGATIRPAVVHELIRLLRSSGYPGYEESGPNAESAVAARIREYYTSRYADSKFVPAAITEAIEQARDSKLRGCSLVQDKCATPSEPATNIAQLSAVLRPLEIVPQRSSRASSDGHEAHEHILGRYQKLEVRTSNSMVSQHRPEYIGMAFPFTLPAAVGGIDFPKLPRWRRTLGHEVAGSWRSGFEQFGRDFWPLGSSSEVEGLSSIS